MAGHFSHVSYNKSGLWMSCDFSHVSHKMSGMGMYVHFSHVSHKKSGMGMSCHFSHVSPELLIFSLILSAMQTNDYIGKMHTSCKAGLM